MGTIKCIFFALVCLCVKNGLIQCSPISPLTIVPETVLLKQPHNPQSEQSTNGDADKIDVLEIPKEIITKIGEMILEMIPGSNVQDQIERIEILEGIEGLKEHLTNVENSKNSQDAVKDTKVKIPYDEQVKDISSEISLGDQIPISDIKSAAPETSLTDTITVEEISDDVTKLVEGEKPAPKGAADVTVETKNRRRRHIKKEEIPTHVVNDTPYVEARFTVDGPPQEVFRGRGGHLAHGKHNIIVSDQDAFNENNRPIIIYVDKCKKIKFDNDDNEGDSDSENFD